MAKDKKTKTRKVRTRGERIQDLERKLAAEKARESLEGLKTAVKDNRVDEENSKEYRKVLRHLKSIEKAPAVLISYGLDDEAGAVSKLRDKIIAKLKNLLEDEQDEDESEEEGEEESEEEGDEEGEEEEEDEDEEEEEEEDEDED